MTELRSLFLHCEQDPFSGFGSHSGLLKRRVGINPLGVSSQCGIEQMQIVVKMPTKTAKRQVEAQAHALPKRELAIERFG